MKVIVLLIVVICTVLGSVKPNVKQVLAKPNQTSSITPKQQLAALINQMSDLKTIKTKKEAGIRTRLINYPKQIKTLSSQLEKLPIQTKQNQANIDQLNKQISELDKIENGDINYQDSEGAFRLTPIANHQKTKADCSGDYIRKGPFLQKPYYINESKKKFVGWNGYNWTISSTDFQQKYLRRHLEDWAGYYKSPDNKPTLDDTTWPGVYTCKRIAGTPAPKTNPNLVKMVLKNGGNDYGDNIGLYKFIGKLLNGKKVYVNSQKRRVLCWNGITWVITATDGLDVLISKHITGFNGYKSSLNADSTSNEILGTKFEDYFVEHGYLVNRSLLKAKYADLDRQQKLLLKLKIQNIAKINSLESGLKKDELWNRQIRAKQNDLNDRIVKLRLLIKKMEQKAKEHKTQAKPRAMAKSPKLNVAGPKVIKPVVMAVKPVIKVVKPVIVDMPKRKPVHANCEFWESNGSEYCKKSEEFEQMKKPGGVDKVLKEHYVVWCKEYKQELKRCVEKNSDKK